MKERRSAGQRHNGSKRSENVNWLGVDIADKVKKIDNSMNMNCGEITESCLS